MKKLLALILLIMIVLQFTLTYAQTGAAQLTVTAWRLNVRSGPGTSYSIIARISRGEVYAIIGRNTNSTWWQINYNNTAGWVSAAYVTATNTNGVPVTTATATPAPTTCLYPTHFAPVCPDTQTTTSAAIQFFQTGMMLWRGDTREIYVLLNSGAFSSVMDTWAGETLPQETPPAGLLQPQMGFGNAWLDYPYIRSGLGWALAAESSYTTTIETTNGSYPGPSDNVMYLNLNDGNIIWINYYASLWGYL